MFGDYNQNDWQGWTPPWMQQGEEGQGPQGQHAHHGHHEHHEHHHGPRGQFGPEWQGPRGPFGGGWRGPRGPFGRGFGGFGPRGPFGPGFGFRGPFGGGWQGPQGQFGPGWQGPSPEMQALRSEAFEVARLFAIAGRTALENKDRQMQLHAMLERTRKELTDMIYSGTSQAQSAGSEPGVEQA